MLGDDGSIVARRNQLSEQNVESRPGINSDT